ncbi:hypothetical protein ZIOFF_033954 [Zingiber officinale]|uniref:Uncharacterized protein n=1 Tax=Zingiber officinale TaxID=94328 RepID=A0A8J5L7T3_ZINOF|nr:hypothetical protein ZIOFF_033954 [Zingiber officinale]
MTMSFLRSFPGVQLPQVLRLLEQDVETVLNVLQPGPLGILEHKFSVAEVQEAKATVRRAIENWQRNSSLVKVASTQHSSEGTPSHSG